MVVWDVEGRPAWGEPNDPSGAVRPVAVGAAKDKAEDDKAKIDLLELFIVLADRKFMVALVAVVAVAVAHVLVSGMPDMYRASTNFTVAKKAKFDLDAFIVVNRGLGSVANDAYGLKQDPTLYSDVLNTTTVFQMVIKKADIKTRPIEKAEEALRKRVDIAISEQGVITIRVDDESPARAAEIANAFVDSLVDVDRGVNQMGLEKLMDFVTNALATTMARLRELEKDFARFSEEFSLIDRGAQVRSSVDQAAQLSKKLMAKRMELKEILNRYAPTSAEVYRIKLEIAGLAQEFESLIHPVDSNSPFAFESMPGRVREQEGLERDVERERDLAGVLSSQLNILKLRKNQPPTNIIRLDRARVPTRPSGPKRMQLRIVAGLLGVMLGGFLALSSEGVRRVKGHPATRDRMNQFLGNLFRLRPRRRAK